MQGAMKKQCRGEGLCVRQKVHIILVVVWFTHLG